MSIEAVLHLMQVNKLGQLPIVDEQRRVIGLHVWDELQEPRSRTNHMVIMAGGKGVRLGEHTQNCPKPMVMVGDKPMLQHIIERAAVDGFTHFHIAIRHLGHMIEEHFGDGRRFGVDIRYLREEAPLGTCGALALLDPVPGEPLLVTNGDVLTDLKYSDMLAYHERHTAAATMAVRAHEWEHPYGVIRTNGVDIVALEEKPVFRTHVNAGIYVIEPRALKLLARDQACDIPAFFERLADEGERTIVYPMHEPWLDVGRPFDLEEARKLHSA
jgi:NDP-sugar pyrophosphorylase family protein